MHAEQAVSVQSKYDKLHVKSEAPPSVSSTYDEVYDTHATVVVPETVQETHSMAVMSSPELSSFSDGEVSAELAAVVAAESFQEVEIQESKPTTRFFDTPVLMSPVVSVENTPPLLPEYSPPPPLPEQSPPPGTPPLLPKLKLGNRPYVSPERSSASSSEEFAALPVLKSPVSPSKKPVISPKPISMSKYVSPTVQMSKLRTPYMQQKLLEQQRAAEAAATAAAEEEQAATVSTLYYYQ